MRILHVSTYDTGGGAEAIAWQLFKQYQLRGHQSTMVVGEKVGNDPQVIPISQLSPSQTVQAPLTRLSRRLAPYEGRIRGAWRIRRWLESYVTHPITWWHSRLGQENFNFPETWKLLAFTPHHPDILHCHNLHGGWLHRGGYFDLRALPWLSRQVPTVLTLHDTWMLSGHCAHALGCERWKSGCGQCPDLSIYPAVARDATAFNWNRKRDIYAGGGFYIATPSRWLLHQVEESILAPAAIQGRVIPNGVDSSVFRPESKHRARAALGLSPHDAILLFVANAAKSNPFKDYQTVEQAARKIAASYRRKRVHLLVVGDTGDPMTFENGVIHFVPFQQDAKTTAQYYQASDVYLHAAKSDTFPNTIIEALACGLPVVATSVGGIPEQISAGRSGFLVPAGNAEAMASQAQKLLENEPLCLSIGETASGLASRTFTIEKQAQAYLDWYAEILAASEVTAHAC
jgi:glycosyltransferase involved in cell wall biosynthesis